MYFIRISVANSTTDPVTSIRLISTPEKKTSNCAKVAVSPARTRLDRHSNRLRRDVVSDSATPSDEASRATNGARAKRSSRSARVLASLGRAPQFSRGTEGFCNRKGRPINGRGYDQLSDPFRIWERPIRDECLAGVVSADDQRVPNRARSFLLCLWASVA